MVSTTSNSPATCSVVAGPAPHTTTLVLDGEFDLACAGRLRAALDEQVRGGRRHIRIDAARVRFLDATVLAVLLEAHTQLLARGGTLVLTRVPARVQRLLGITGLDRVLFRAEPPSRRGRRTRPLRVPRRRGSGRLRLLRPALPTS
ncbi:MAG TPA: STAS domain-containing protein [Jatrophihabitantaceae bacterium]